MIVQKSYNFYRVQVVAAHFPAALAAVRSVYEAANKNPPKHLWEVHCTTHSPEPTMLRAKRHTELAEEIVSWDVTHHIDESGDEAHDLFVFDWKILGALAPFIDDTAYIEEAREAFDECEISDRRRYYKMGGKWVTFYQTQTPFLPHKLEVDQHPYFVAQNLRCGLHEMIEWCEPLCRAKEEFAGELQWFLDAAENALYNQYHINAMSFTPEELQQQDEE